MWKGSFKDNVGRVPRWGGTGCGGEEELLREGIGKQKTTSAAVTG